MISALRNTSLSSLLRGIDRHLALDDLRQSLKPFYSQMGRPSVDPELMIRMLIVGYCMGIRSERRLCDEVHLNLAYRWFLKAGMGCQLRWFRLARWEALGRVQASL